MKKNRTQIIKMYLSFFSRYLWKRSDHTSKSSIFSSNHCEHSV